MAPLDVESGESFAGSMFTVAVAISEISFSEVMFGDISESSPNPATAVDKRAKF